MHSKVNAQLVAQKPLFYPVLLRMEFTLPHWTNLIKYYIIGD